MGSSAAAPAVQCTSRAAEQGLPSSIRWAPPLLLLHVVVVVKTVLGGGGCLVAGCQGSDEIDEFAALSVVDVDS